MFGIAIVSGGMDSVTMAHKFVKAGDQLHVISFDYGQRHVKELSFAEECARDLGMPWDYVDLTNVNKFLGGSSLTDRSVDVPDGHYAAETMKQTVVPNRNAIMLSIATGIAVAEQADYVATAVHAGDHFIYPDCRADFIDVMGHAMFLANRGFAVDQFHLEAPFLTYSKRDIGELGLDLNVDFTKTWSCYKGGEIHCGTCGTCYERREALQGFDPTEYLDNTTKFEEPV
jgi:7-cyano-7-deazaguanine synthase